MSSRCLAIWLVGLTLLPACGRKEPPEPPPSRVPAPVSNLSVQQRGTQLLLRMSYPTTTIGGLPIEHLEAVEVWEVRRIVSSFLAPSLELEAEGSSVDEDSESDDALAGEEVEPVEPDEPDAAEEEEGLLFRMPKEDAAEEDPPEQLIEISPLEFSQLATLRWSLSGSELEATVVGDSLLLRIPIEEIPQEDEVWVLGARAVAARRLVSPISNLVKLMPRTPPPAPTELTVEARPTGIELGWKGAGEVEGFNVYRRNANVRDYGTPLFFAPPDVERFQDVTAEFGSRYLYTVTSVISRLPMVESSIAAEHEVNYKDRFPPLPPRDPVALPEPGRVRVLWEPSLSDDVRGYLVFRQAEDGEFRAISTDIVLGSEYLDRDLASGRTYRYYVVAVDGAENQSRATDEIEARVP